MAVIEGGTSAELAGVGAEAAKPAHAVLRHLPHDWQSHILGHYRTSVRILSTAALTANAPLFALQVVGSNPIVLTRLTLRAAQVAAGTAQANAIEAIRFATFTDQYSGNAVTTSVSVKRQNMEPTAQYGVKVRHWNGTGTAGMQTVVADVDGKPAFGALEYRVAAAIDTARIWGPYEVVDDVNGTHPFVFSQWEGFLLRNRTTNVTSYGIAWYIDCSWAEVPSF
jgi:hypothetical protein